MLPERPGFDPIQHNNDGSWHLSPAPVSRLRFTKDGLEVVIRYPVELDNTAEIDHQITRELLAVLGRDGGCVSWELESRLYRLLHKKILQLRR